MECQKIWRVHNLEVGLFSPPVTYLFQAICRSYRVVDLALNQSPPEKTSVALFQYRGQICNLVGGYTI